MSQSFLSKKAEGREGMWGGRRKETATVPQLQMLQQWSRSYQRCRDRAEGSHWTGTGPWGPLQLNQWAQSCPEVGLM